MQDHKKQYETMEVHLLCRRTLTTGFLALLLWATSGLAEEPDYFPLQEGNVWIYKYTHRELRPVSDDSLESATTEEIVTLEVVSREEVAGNIYFRLNNGQLLRKNEEGNIAEYNDRFDFIETDEFVIFDFTNLNDAGYKFYFPYKVFPPTLGEPQVSLYPAGRSLNHPDVQVPVGTFKTLTFDHTTGIAEVYVIDLAEDVGVVRSVKGGDFGADDVYELVEAHVNGRNYLQPTAIWPKSWAMIKSRN